MNIFNWAQDHNIIWLENIDWWLMKKSLSLYRVLHPSNRLNPKRAKKICQLMFNKICINPMDKLVRLIGFGDDEEDFYYITKDANGKIVWESMVGYLIPLKGRISNVDYFRIERGFVGWGRNPGKCQPEKEFMSLYEPGKLSFQNIQDIMGENE